MTVDEVKAALKKNPQFGYRGDRDFSLLPGTNRVLIETESVSGMLGISGIAVVPVCSIITPLLGTYLKWQK